MCKSSVPFVITCRRRLPAGIVANFARYARDSVLKPFFLKKGDARAAANRFREATKWNDGNAEAWLALAEAEEKNKNLKSAREAYEKYLRVAPDARNATEVKKKLDKLTG